ncbi:hypothetical protein DL93DRAFT_2100226 [Clavulina sp. PMI_390]|nr:hypothetical protein DL93DRAFT_2100226 [Clavulina sp. PMI_390]
MRVSSLTPVALLGTLIQLVPSASAVDFRILVKFNPRHYHSGDAFCTKWLSACRSYTPKDTSLYYIGSLCHPGDYQGKNNHTEALVTCVFEKSVADGVVHELGIQHI